MRDLVITGATGLVGAHLLPKLAGDRLHLLGRLKCTKSEAEHYDIDLGEPIPVDQLPRPVDAVIYLAQSNHFREFPRRADDIFSVNTVAPLELAKYAVDAKAKTFIFLSTGGVYKRSSVALAEDDPLQEPIHLGFYAATKLSTEFLLQQFAPFLNIIILRPFFIYGRHQKREMLIPRLIGQIVRREDVTIQGVEGLHFNPVHASDAARCVERALHLDHSAVINVAGPEVWSLRALSELVGRRAGVPVNFQRDAQVDDLKLIGDTSRMEALLATPAVRISDVLGELMP